MIKPRKHPHEAERLMELESFSILDTLTEDDFDNMTTIASEICGTPISLISLIDDKRQWFKSHHGLDVHYTDKKYAFCAHAINDQDNVMIVSDARLDDRFHDNPLVAGDPFVIFYAGVPLITENGLPLGTLCVIDHQPKLLSKSQLDSLKALAKQVMNLMELRKIRVQKEKAILDLEAMNLELDRFASVAAHDIKSPLNNITSLAKILGTSLNINENAEHRDVIKMIEGSCATLKNLVDGLLQYSKTDIIARKGKDRIDLNHLIKSIEMLFSYDNNLEIRLNSKLKTIDFNSTALEQILINLVANGIKYNDSDRVTITIDIEENPTHYIVSVSDNGRGIEDKDLSRIFNIFEHGESKDRYGQIGSGIGLATVKKVVNSFEGDVSISSTAGNGSTFTCSLKK